MLDRPTMTDHGKESPDDFINFGEQMLRGSPCSVVGAYT
jgi:hypothetical protein